MSNNGSTALADNEIPTPTGHDQVVLVLNAGTETGYRIARDLLRCGYRVAVTGRHAPRLTRVLTGVSATRVFVIAAEPSDRRQAAELIERVEAAFGQRIELVIRAEDDIDSGPNPIPLCTLPSRICDGSATASKTRSNF